MNEHNDGIEQVNSGDIPVWNKNYLPEEAHIIMLVEEENFDYGGTISAAYRLPLDRIVANNTKQGNIFTVVDIDAQITIPEGAIVPAYIESFEPYSLKRAQASSQTTKARFLILSVNQNVDGGYVVQSSGYYTFTEPHQYSVGQLYYLSATTTGGVTTIAPSPIAQPLFYVIDNQTIQILIGA